MCFGFYFSNGQDGQLMSHPILHFEAILNLLVSIYKSTPGVQKNMKRMGVQASALKM